MVRAAFKGDPVFFIGIALSILLIIFSNILLIVGPEPLRKFAFSVAMSMYDLDGTFEQATLDTINNLLAKTWLFLLASGGFALLYSLIWRYFSARLPENPPSTIRKRHQSIARWEVLAIIAVLFIGTLFRLHGMTRGFSFDEIWTAVVFVDTPSFWETISLNQSFSNHLANSVLAKISFEMLGKDEWALRLPALLLGLVTIYYVWFFGRELLSAKTATSAAFILTVFPLHVVYSQSARGYAGMVLFSLVSIDLYLKLLETPTRGKALKFVLAGFAAVYFHLYAVFVLCVQFLHLLAICSRQVSGIRQGHLLNQNAFRTLWLSIGATFILCLLGYAPALPTMILDFAPIRQGSFNAVLPLTIFHYLSGNTSYAISGAVFLLFILGLTSLTVSRSQEGHFFIVLFGVPVCAVWLLWRTWIYSRFFLFLLAPYILFAASGHFKLWYLNPNRFGKDLVYGFRVVLLVIGLLIVCCWGIKSWQAGQDVYGFREAVAAMEKGADESVALCAIGGVPNFYGYYARNPILAPSNMEELHSIIDTYPETRCAYLQVWWQDELQTQMAAFLSQTARSQDFGSITVFTHAK